MKLVIASGKGGTGKTTVALSLAYYLSKSRKVKLLDCDVEAPNDHLFLPKTTLDFKSVCVGKPQWNKSNCTLCGECVKACKYQALAKVKDKIIVFDELCHSCGACFYFCPNKALDEKERTIGRVRTSRAGLPFSFVDGELSLGESLAPKVIESVKKEMSDDSFNIVDSSPGTSCPVVKSFAHMDQVLLVTEATPFGKHDLELAIQLASQMNLPTSVVINRSIGEDSLIEDLCRDYSVPVIGKIPYSRVYAESYSRGEVLINRHPELEVHFQKIVEYIESKQSRVPKFKKEEHISFPAEAISSYGFEDLLMNTPFQEVVVISGKGGTGKTTVSAALADLLDNIIVSDCDVDASNLHLILKPKLISTTSFTAGSKSRINQELCNQCGLCSTLCRFNAIDQKLGSFVISDHDCEGCGLCLAACPSKAIEAVVDETGLLNTSIIRGEIPFCDAALKVGADNSGKLVSQVRANAKKFVSSKKSFLLNDGPPGTSCPVISSLVGAKYAIVVTEPTLSGIHDMQRVLELAKHFRVIPYIVINKADINLERTKWIYLVAQENQSKVLGEIPYDSNVYQALKKGQTLIAYKNGPAYEAILNIYNEFKKNIGEKNV